jgi:hypothetical protein
MHCDSDSEPKLSTNRVKRSLRQPEDHTINKLIEYAEEKANKKEPTKEARAIYEQTIELPPQTERMARYQLIMDTIQRHRERAIRDLPSNATKADLKTGLKQLSKHMREEVILLGSLQDLVRQDGNIYRRQQLPEHIDPQTLYPSKVGLYSTTEFGKYNTNKSWITTNSEEPTGNRIPINNGGLYDVVIILLKGSWLTDVEKEAVAQINVQFTRISRLLQATRRIDFRALQLPNFDWKQSEEGGPDQIDYNKMLLRLACWFHYDGMIEFVQRYCGWRHTGEHVRRKQMLFWMRILLPKQEFQELEHGYLQGLPYKLQSVPANNKHELAKYVKMGNSATLLRHPELVWKLLSKEDRREFSLLLPNICQRFTPHRWKIVLGLTTPEGKKPRIYRDCSKLADKDTSRPHNSIAEAENEPRITFGNASVDFLFHIWKLRAVFPELRLNITGDDESSCFNQKQFTPSITPSQMVQFGHVIAFSTGNHFGGNWGPADNEPVARAKELLVEFLVEECSYQRAMNADVLADLQLEFPERSEPIAAAKYEPSFEEVRRDNSMPKIKYRMYVDDSQGVTSATRLDVETLIASSHEAAYILRGFPGPMTDPLLPSTIADDKQDRIVGPSKLLLGKIIDADSLFVSLPAKKLERFWQLLRQNWNRQRKQFTLRDAAQLQGNLIYCLSVHGWLQPLLFYIPSALKLAMEKNVARLRYDTRFKALMEEPSEDWLEPAAIRQPSRLLGLRHEYARALWRCEAKTHIPKTIHDQCEWLASMVKSSLDDPSRHPWKRHIGHMVPRLHDFTAYDDASSGVGAGGHSIDLGFWYQVKWADVSLPFADWVKKTLNNGLVTDAHINWLEYIATALCLAGAVVTYDYRVQTGYMAKLGWPPLYHINGDNNTSNKAATKGTAGTSSKVARALACVVSDILRVSGAAMRANRVDTKSNQLADSLSRLSLVEVTAEILLLRRDRPHLVSFYFDPLDQASNSTTLMNSPLRFQPSNELLSSIASAALNPDSTGLLQFDNVRSLGQVSPDSSIFFDL